MADVVLIRPPWFGVICLHYIFQVVDEKNPIALTSETVVVVNGKKCVLRVDPESNHLVAYPVKTEGILPHFLDYLNEKLRWILSEMFILWTLYSR